MVGLSNQSQFRSTWLLVYKVHSPRICTYLLKSLRIVVIAPKKEEEEEEAEEDQKKIVRLKGRKTTKSNH